MRSAGFKVFLLVLLSLSAHAIVFGFSAEETPGASQSLRGFTEIKTRLEGVEKAQQDILAQKEKILEELDRLRVRVRHSGNKPAE